MRTNWILFTLVAAGIAATSLASESSKSPAPAATLGHLETAKWTATTSEAATTDAQRKVLASGKPVTVTGEVVDYSCFMQLGKRGEAHIACGTKCIQNGMPVGLVTANGKLYLLIPEEHHPRRDGQVEIKSVFLPYLAKTVTVTGVLTERKDSRALFVEAAQLGGAAKP